MDVDRLLQGLVILTDPETGASEVGVYEKAVSALESLLFAKYQMFRNVYWHHGVRAAAALYKRIINDAVGARILDAEELVGPTDEELLYETTRPGPRNRIRRLESGWPLDGFRRLGPVAFRSVRWR